MAPAGSVFDLLPKGVVVDIGCTLFSQLATDYVNEDIPLNTNGTINDIEASRIETLIKNAMNDSMLSTGMLSAPGVVIAVDRTNNVRTGQVVNIAASLYGKGYVLQINGTIGLAS